MPNKIEYNPYITMFYNEHDFLVIAMKEVRNMAVQNPMYKIIKQEGNSCPCDALARLTAESVAYTIYLVCGEY